MIILDTSVWVAYLNKDDSQYRKATRLFDALSDSAIIGVPEYIILEVCTVLITRASKEIADGFLEYILDNKNITVLHAHPELFFATVDIFRTERSGKLAFADAVLLALSKDYRVITFDKALAKALASPGHV